MLTQYKLFIVLIIALSPSCKNYEKNKNQISDYSDLKMQANAYYEREDYFNAKKYFDLLLSKDSINGEYYYKRAYCRYRLYDSRAKLDYLKAIELNYKNKKGALLGIGTIFRIEGEYDSALFYYNKSLEIDSNYARGKMVKAELLEIMKEQK